MSQARLDRREADRLAYLTNDLARFLTLTLSPSDVHASRIGVNVAVRSEREVADAPSRRPPEVRSHEASRVGDPAGNCRNRLIELTFARYLSRVRDERPGIFCFHQIVF